MIPRLNGIKQCSVDNMNECFAESVDGLDLTPTNAVSVPDGSVIANNGMNFIIDINGPAEPNVAGTDVFQYKLEKVKGDNQTAMLQNLGTVTASLFNSLTPSALAYYVETSAPEKNCPSCGWCGGTERYCATPERPKDDLNGIEIEHKPSCLEEGTCITPYDGSSSSGGSTSSSSSSSGGGDQIVPEVSSSSGSSSSSSSSSGGQIINPSGSSSSSSSSSSGGEIIIPDDATSSSGGSSGSTSGGGNSSSGSTSGSSSGSTSGSSSGSTSSGGSSSGGENGTNDTDVSFDSATNTAGWRFVPVGKTADIMNNNWKIKAW